MRRVAIINFTGFRGNWGCQATSFELIKFIAGCFPDGTALKLDCVPLLPGSRVDQSYDARLDEVFEAFSAVAAGDQGSPLALLTQACEARYGFWADIVKAADLVVFQAEGSMGLGANFARGPRLMLLPFVAKHAWGRRVISLNQTFYSHDARIRQNAAEAFGSFDFTAFREGASVSLARQCGVQNAAYVPDVAFLSRPSGGKDLPSGDYFAVSGSALKDPRRYDLILDQTRRIADATGLKPLIAVSRDLQMKLKVLTGWRSGSYALVPRGATYTHVTRYLGQTRFLLGGRYHMSIMAAAAGAPNIVLTGNSFKSEGLVSLLASPRPVFDFDETEAIVSAAVEAAEQQQAERAQVARQVSLIRQTLADAQDHLRAMINGQDPGPFRDALPEFSLTPETLTRYAAFGKGTSAKPSWVLPGDRLGRRASPQAVLGPLVEGLAGDPETLAVLRRLAAGDPAMAAELRRRGVSLAPADPAEPDPAAR